MKHLYTAAVAALALVTSGLAAQAGCGPMNLHGKAAKATRMPAPALAAGRDSGSNDGSIVGLWHVQHLDNNGQLFFEAFQQWHSDGSEWEFANFPATLGNMCLGVWHSKNLRTVEMNHIAWNFDENENSIGTIVMLGTFKLNTKANHFEGPTEYKFYDVDGNLTDDIHGSSVADRILPK